ncbi:uncharacterized protein LY89DRAFT_683475 [Mollisia scopiformis]|uniref:Uncharacterized protein n=1 Tax=Mollisia scopiformis TaxID=149040 RepID=A0A194XEA2_MOLSC|nr:uncharacterized protein LY89DRAFT_683475 [Mollisia scopiformis]KUJ18515.1 hypothetical protein LY89DRAFT_683475 [Mollisia scopiformis]
MTTIDLANNGNTLYAIWNAEFQMKIPGQEGTMEGNGILRVVLKDGKVAVWTFFEDPTPFVAMAMKGQMG